MQKSADQNGVSGPRIYNLFPTLLGPVERWEERLPAIARMGFDWIFLNPFHEPGESGSLYSVKDYYRLHPALGGDAGEAADRRLARFCSRAREAGLSVMLDLIVNHTARDSPLVVEHPEWYAREAEGGAVRSPFAVDPQDHNNITVWADLAELDYRDRPERAALMAYWDRLVAHYVKLGFAGFRCDAAYKIPGAVWGELIAAARDVDPGVVFFAETLGAQLSEVDRLRPAGFDYFFNSSKWWDFRADWLLEQYERFRHVAPSIAFPETHDTLRVAGEFDGSERESRFRYLFAAFFSTGVMMPIGYELGFRRPLHVVETGPDDWEAEARTPAFDITELVRAANGMKARTRVLNEEGPQTRFTDPSEPVVGLLRRCERGPQRAAALINPDPEQRRELPCNRLVSALESEPGSIREITPLREDTGAPDRTRVRLDPRSIRVFLAE